MRRSPEDIGLLPDGDAPREPVMQDGKAVAWVDTEYPWTLREALRTRAAWVLVGAQALGSMGLYPVVVHQVAFVQEKGFSLAVATTVATTVAFFSMAGKVPWGLLTERFHVRWVTAACLMSAGFSLTLLIFAGDLLMLYVYAVIYGATMSGLPSLTNIIWAHYFGRKHTGAIRGALSPAVQALSASSPVIVAFFWDVQGNYTLAFWLVSAFWIGGGLLALLAAPPRPPKAASG
jgi:MFS family permease